MSIADEKVVNEISVFFGSRNRDRRSIIIGGVINPRRACLRGLGGVIPFVLGIID
jgi:hypothetical protein